MTTQNNLPKEDLADLLKMIAKKLGTTSEYLWASLLKNAVISALCQLIYLLLCGIAWYIVYQFKSEIVSVLVGDTGWIVAILCPLVILTIITLIQINGLKIIVDGFFNKEYSAFTEVMNYIHAPKS